jgi:hypothetical protein
MTSDRRDLLDPRVRSALERASPEQLRRLALAAATCAVQSIETRPSELDDLLSEAQGFQGEASIADRVRLLAEELDDRYLALHAESGGDTSDREVLLFRVARAAAAIAFACEPDPEYAASESLYEATHALGTDAEKLLEIARMTTSGG